RKRGAAEPTGGRRDDREVRRAKPDRAYPAPVAADASFHHGEGDYGEDNRRSFCIAREKDFNSRLLRNGLWRTSLERMDGLILGLGLFLRGRTNLSHGGVQHLSLRKTYAGTQVAVIALQDDLAATALKLGHLRIGWVNLSHPCSRGGLQSATTAGALVTWPLAARVLTSRSPATDAARRAIKQKASAKANHRAFFAESEELTTIVMRQQARAALLHGRSLRTADDENPPAQPQSLRGCPQDLLCDTIKQAAHRRGNPVVSNTRTLLHPIHGLPMPTAKQLSGCREEFRCRSARRKAADGTPVHSMRTVSLPPCPAHRSLPGTAEDMASTLMAVITGACECLDVQGKSLAAVCEPVLYWWTAEITDLRFSLVCGLADSSRDRVAGMTKKPHSASYASARRLLRVGDQDQQATVFETALRRGRQRRLGQILQDCPCRACDARRPSSPSSPLLVRSTVAERVANFVPACGRTGRPCSAALGSGAYPGRHPGGTRRNSVEDQEALRARPGWHTQLSAQDRYCHTT
ncbi:unnamed protein product, partial [Trichogramma brassicae]